MISGVAGLRPNFFLQRPNFLAELAQESWRDLAAVEHNQYSNAINFLSYVHFTTLK